MRNDAESTVLAPMQSVLIASSGETRDDDRERRRRISTSVCQRPAPTAGRLGPAWL